MGQARFETGRRFQQDAYHHAIVPKDNPNFATQLIVDEGPGGLELAQGIAALTARETGIPHKVRELQNGEKFFMDTPTGPQPYRHINNGGIHKVQKLTW